MEFANSSEMKNVSRMIISVCNKMHMVTKGKHEGQC